MIGLVVATLMVLADEPPARPDHAPKVVVTQPDESKFPEIRVYFEVRRGGGEFVRDAKREDFRVFEEGKEQAIDSFDAPITVSLKPTTIVLVVDRSGSMAQSGKMPGLRSAVRTFLDGLPVGSRVAVIAFGSRVDLACPFTTDLDEVRGAIDGIRPVGATRYFDAVLEALRLLEREPGRRAILALTDGQDTDSEVPIETPIAEARRLGLPVHTLGLGRDGELDADALDRLAAGTRGQSYRARDAAALKLIYQELAERLGSTYSLTYRTDRRIPDGTLRPIKIVYVPSASSSETAVFIPGMVVPAGGWPKLFLTLLAALGILAAIPFLLSGRSPARDDV